jgi:hypothetical protein
MIHLNFIVTPSSRGIGIFHSCKVTPSRHLSPSKKQTAPLNTYRSKNQPTKDKAFIRPAISFQETPHGFSLL